MASRGLQMKDEKPQILHSCRLAKYPFQGYGSALDDCTENQEGELWVDNGEYATQVNFCPVCGHKAKKQVNGSMQKIFETSPGIDCGWIITHCDCKGTGLEDGKLHELERSDENIPWHFQTARERLQKSSDCSKARINP